MKSEADIREKIKLLEISILSEKTKRFDRDRDVNWLHSLNWVLEDEKAILKDRLEAIRRESSTGKDR